MVAIPGPNSTCTCTCTCGGFGLGTATTWTISTAPPPPEEPADEQQPPVDLPKPKPPPHPASDNEQHECPAKEWELCPVFRKARPPPETVLFFMFDNDSFRETLEELLGLAAFLLMVAFVLVFPLAAAVAFIKAWLQ